MSRHRSGPRMCLRVFGLLPVCLLGCEAVAPVHSAAARAAVTPTDGKLTFSDYWWNQPAVATATASAADFTRLWDACEAETRRRLFLVDREEYREGLLTTAPLISKQVFEPWRTDAVTWHDETEPTLGTIRRTVRFEIRRRPDDTFEMVPKVLVERFASAERRLTSIHQYQSAFSGPRAFADGPDLSGDATAHDAVADYWYPLHRDPRPGARPGRERAAAAPRVRGRPPERALAAN